DDLAEDIFAKVRAAARAGDDQAGGQRDQEGGNLADQPIADGQLGVEVEAVHDRPAALDHADVKAAKHVDEDDDDAGDGVAADELASAVHCAVEVGFLRDFRAAPP